MKAKVGDIVIELHREHRCLQEIPESDQLNLFVENYALVKNFKR